MCLRWLVTGLSPRRPGFDHRPVYVGFVVDNVALGRGFLRVLLFSGKAQSVERVATGWTVRGSNPDGSDIFGTRPDRLWAPPSLLCNGYRVFPGGKATGTWRDPPPPSSAEVKERVEVYLYSPSGPSCPVLGWTLPFYLHSGFRLRPKKGTALHICPSISDAL